MSNGYRVIACKDCDNSAVAYSDSEAYAWVATHECLGVV